MADSTQVKIMAEVTTAELSEKEAAELHWAYQHLENPSLAARLSNVFALPIEDSLL